MFLGVANLNLDSKGHMAIPAKYRERLQDSCASRLVVTINPREHCLWMYPENEWREIERKIAKLPTLKGPNLVMQRLLLGHASEVEMDGQGRILLSPELREYAGLEKRVAVVGEGHKFELWDEGQWISQREEWLRVAGDGESELSEELQNLVL